MATNYDLLKGADIIDDGKGLTDEQRQQLEDLSPDEIQALIAIKKKLSKFNWPIQTIIMPRMF
jgi:hypothetical protein